MRAQLDGLVRMLSAIDTPVDLTLTTNGSLLRSQAARLKAAGLKRITVSLDSLDDAVFKAMNDTGVGVATVLDGIEAALEVARAVQRYRYHEIRHGSHEVAPVLREQEAKQAPAGRVSLELEGAHTMVDRPGIKMWSDEQLPGRCR